jgi:signal transduction histidine kinase
MGVGGFGIYRLIVYASWSNLEQEMAAIAAPLQTTLEPSLKHPGHLDASIHQQLPGICMPIERCESVVQPQQVVRTDSQLMERIAQGQYCVRLLDREGTAIAMIRFAGEKLAPCTEESFWQSRMGPNRDEYYHQVLHSLYTPKNQKWGKLQITRSTDNLDLFLFAIELTLLIGIPVIVVIISLTSWWLAKFAMRPVQDSYQQMQQFTADAAHELRTPLAALRAMVQTALRAEELSIAEARETMEIIDRQSQRLTHLVQALLLLSQLDHQTQMSDPKPCRLNQIIEAVVEELRALAETQQINLTTLDQPLSDVEKS